MSKKSLANEMMDTGDVMWHEDFNKKEFSLLFRNSCSNSCTFCTTRIVNGSMKNILPEKKEHVFAAIRLGASKGFNKIKFIAFEPLEHPSIVDFITYSKNFGFSNIELWTNGKKFRDSNFLKKLINSGLTKVKMPIFGHKKEIHDSISQTPGSFDDLIQGLDNLKKFKLKYSVHMAIVKENYPYLLDVVDFCYTNKYLLEWFNIAAPSTTDKRDYKKYIFHISDMVEEFNIKKYNFKKKVLKFTFIKLKTIIPLCILVNLIKDKLFRKRFQFPYLQLDYFFDPQNAVKNNSSTINPTNKKIDLSLPRSGDLKNRALSKKCINCKYGNYCSGIYQQYIDIFGDDELNPLPTRL